MAEKKMSASEAYGELGGMARMFKAFARLDEVLQAAALTEKEQAEKQRLLDEVTKRLESAKVAVSKQEQDVEAVKFAAQTKLDATKRWHADEQDRLALVYQAKKQELEEANRVIVEARRLAADELTKLNAARAETARLIQVEEAKVQAAGKIKVNELNAQAFALQTKVDELKLKLRTTMDEASRLL